MNHKSLSIALLFFFISCAGQKQTDIELYYDPNSFITLDMNFISEVRSKVSASQKKYLIYEKENLINQKINNVKFLELLNIRIKDVDIFTGDIFYNVFLKEIISKRKKNVHIKSLYFINIGYNAETYQWESAILIENFDGNIQLFKNDGKKIEYLNSDLLDFTNDFMRTYVYSGKNTLLINGYFTIDRIKAVGINTFEVTSIVAPEMQFSQLEILKKFYKLSGG